jgi:fucose permease
VILGAAHGSYGIGGIIAPILGTAMVSHGILWSRFYFITLGLRICCIAFIASTWWSYKEDTPAALISNLERTAGRQTTDEECESKLRNLKQALKNRVTIFGALFIFAYQGAEVSVSGWVISFLISYRGGDPASVGYVTAGFWVRLHIVLLNCMEEGIQLTDNLRVVSHLAASYSLISLQKSERRNSSLSSRLVQPFFNS